MLDSAPRHLPADMPLPTGQEASPYSRRRQLLQALLNNNELLLKNQLEVGHLMTPDPIVIAPTMRIDEIASLMEKQQVHQLLVGGIGGNILGVVNDSDVRARRGTTALQLMHSPAVVVSPDTPLSPALTYLLSEGSTCLVVIDHGRLCGILPATDLILTLQCMLQLWMRLSQAIDQESSWAKGLDEIAAGLKDEIPAAQLAARIRKARSDVHRHIGDLIGMIDLQLDVPTDMANRRGLENALGRLLAVKRRFGNPFSLVMVAIDHFRDIKEGCGSAVANRLVEAVARLLHDAVRDCDYMARCRDDAFAVALPQSSLAEAEAFCRQLQTAALRDRELKMEIRIRVGAIAPLDGEDVSELLARAESVVS